MDSNKILRIIALICLLILLIALLMAPKTNCDTCSFGISSFLDDYFEDCTDKPLGPKDLNISFEPKDIWMK